MKRFALFDTLGLGGGARVAINRRKLHGGRGERTCKKTLRKKGRREEGEEGRGEKETEH